MAISGGQQRLDWYIVPDVPTTIALVTADGSDWPSAPRVLVGALVTTGEGVGTIDVVIPEITAVIDGVDGSLALATVDDADMATILAAYPLTSRTALPWHVRLGTGEGETAVSTGALVWDVTGQRATTSLTLVVGPKGPTAVSTDPGNAAELGTDGLIFVSPTAGSAHVIQDEGVALTNRAALNFVGTGVTATDDAGNGATLVTITAGAVASVNGETGAVSLSAADVGAEPAKGADDNYVTDAEKTKLSNLSGTNTGDQTLPTWSTIAGKPAVVAEGATAADARTAIGAGTSSFSGAYADLSGKPTLGTAAATAATDYATAAQGSLAASATQPGDDAADLGSAAATDGYVLTADGAGGAAWEAVPAGGSPALDDLSDVATAGAATGEALTYNGSSWAPSATAAILEGDARLTDARTPTSHNHAASEVTSGTLDIARIPTGSTGTTVSLGNHAHSGVYEPVKGADDNYVTDAQLVIIGNTSGTNTGDDAPQVQTINAQTGTTYTPVASDWGKLVTLSNAGAITVTLPQDSDLTFAIGKRIDFVVIGAGMATFAAGTGATVNGTPSLVTRAQWSAATAYKRAANTWLVVGDLA